MEDWPVSLETQVIDLPERHSKVVLTAETREVATLADRINISRFSKVRFLLNTTARILTLYKRYKREDGIPKEIKVAELTVSDVEAAERFWILEAQTLSNKAVKEGKLVRLCPRYKDGVIVVGGRARRWMQAVTTKP